MKMREEDKISLINYRMGQAFDTVEEVELLLENDKLRAAMNRLYYGLFYSLLALGLKYDFSTLKHQQLIGWFNKEFIHTKKIDRRYGQTVKIAFNNRIKGDYETSISFEKSEIEKLLNEMKEFIQMIANFIKKV